MRRTRHCELLFDFLKLLESAQGSELLEGRTTIQDTGHVRLAYFSDTDGNNFYLSETP